MNRSRNFLLSEPGVDIEKVAADYKFRHNEIVTKWNKQNPHERKRKLINDYQIVNPPLSEIDEVKRMSPATVFKFINGSWFVDLSEPAGGLRQVYILDAELIE